MSIRAIRKIGLTEDEDRRLKHAVYVGNPKHKKHPGNFGLTPPVNPHRDATLCEEALVFTIEKALEIWRFAQGRGMVSVATAEDGMPKQIWAVSPEGLVFEALYSGNSQYHGYPLRKSDPMYERIRKQWKK